MKSKQPNTSTNLKSNFIANAALNSALALQMAQQVWSTHAWGDTQINDCVEIINSVSLKLKRNCQQLNHEAHSNFDKEKYVEVKK